MVLGAGLYFRPTCQRAVAYPNQEDGVRCRLLCARRFTQGIVCKVVVEDVQGAKSFLFVRFTAVLAPRISLYLLSLMKATYKLRVCSALQYCASRRFPYQMDVLLDTTKNTYDDSSFIIP